MIAVALGFLACEQAVAEDEAEDKATGGETSDIMKQVTITMVSEVIDSRTIEIRDGTTRGRKLIRLGNVVAPEKGSLSDEEFAQREAEAKAALEKLVGKQMMLYKVAPDEQQVKSEEGEDEVVLADAWTVDGRHLPTFMAKEGHLVSAKVYHEPLAEDILTAKADADKKEGYKKLEEALKESAKATKAEKVAQAKKQREEEKKLEEAEDVVPIGVGGWICLVLVCGLILGVATNFGFKDTKKKNPNRKQGFFENMFSKLKGA